MKIKQAYKGITKKTQKLLESGENEIVDYKERTKGIKSEDLVAFANSEKGGILLIGVEEIEENGRQKGKIIGCDISDKSKLIIMSKALNCTPPISLSIIVENLSNKAFFRIEIPSGSQKPYCTDNGTYKIRKDGRNHSLKPDELLNIYLKKEAEKFKERFKEATDHVVDSIQSVSSTIDFMESTISSKVEDIASTLGWTEYEASNAKSTIDNVEGYVRRIIRDLNKTNKRVKAVVSHLDIKDPLKLEYMNEIAKKIIPELEEDEKLFKRAEKGELTFKADGGEFKLSEEDIKTIVEHSVKYIKKKRKEEEE